MAYSYSYFFLHADVSIDKDLLKSGAFRK
jgi:hypothetical protein